MRGWGGDSGLGVDFEADYEIVLLAGGEEIGAGGVDGEAADSVSFCVGKGWAFKGVVGVDFEGSDGILSPVTDIEEVAGGVEEDFGGGVFGCVLGVDGGEGLEFGEFAGCGIDF